MRYLFLALVGLLFLAGCVQTYEQPTKSEIPKMEQKCRTVEEQIPYEEEVCKEILVTNERCDFEQLSYEVEQSGPTYICSKDGDCSGAELSTCRECTTAVARCTATVTNTDDVAGAWTVVAKFNIGEKLITKEPIVLEILPNESAVFDFQQFYSTRNARYAGCELEVTPPTVLKCVEETEPSLKCTIEEKVRTETKEICE